MMKNNIILHISKYITLMCLAITALCACQDEALFNYDEYLYDSDALLFQPYIGVVNVATRSAEEQEELDPLIIEGDGEKLYLHTYVCDNSFNPVYNPDTCVVTRGAQVNYMADFNIVHTNFGVKTVYRDGGAPYVSGVTEAVGEDCAVWRLKGNKAYWPGDDAMLSIFAWAPDTLPSTLTNLQKIPGQVQFSYEAQRSSDGKKDAEAQTDILLAMVDSKKSISEDGKAKLQFTHPLSAIKFAVRDVVADTIKSISIKGVNTKGDCVYTLTAPENANGYFTDSSNGNYSWTNQSEPGEFTQEFDVAVMDYIDPENPDKGKDVSITAQKPAATFMMIPQEIPDDAVIEVEMKLPAKDKDGFEARTLKLRGKINSLGNSGNITKWEAGKEYVYTISSTASNWTYVFEVTQPKVVNYQGKFFVPILNDDAIPNQGNTFSGENVFKVSSYRHRTNSWTAREALDWTVTEYLDSVGIADDGKGNFSSKGSTLPGDSWIEKIEKISDEGIGVSNYKIFYKNPYTELDLDAVLRAAPLVTNPYDLSTKGGTVPQTTANCYIVQAAGTYTFPAVYGNAITNGADYTASYKNVTGQNVEDNRRRLTNFKNYLNKPINKSNIIDDVKSYGVSESGISASVIWEDVVEYTEKDVEGVKEYTFTKGLIKSVSYSDGKINFEIDKNNIKQGNAVIGLKDGQGNIMWSWHIWVTGIDYDRVATLNSLDNKKYDIMPVNLGWCSKAGDKIRYYDRHQYKVKYKQDRSKYSDAPTTGTEKEIDIIQEPHIATPQGNNTYYQWGRKDPFVGTDKSRESKPWWLFEIPVKDKDGKPQAGYPKYKFPSHAGFWLNLLMQNGTQEQPVWFSQYITHIPYNMDITTMPGHIEDRNTTRPFTKDILGELIKNPYKLNNPRLINYKTAKMYAILAVDENGNPLKNSKGEQYYIPAWENVVQKDVRSNDSIYSDLWIDKFKTIYDPCPPGYKVSDHFTFYGFTVRGGQADGTLSTHAYSATTDNMLAGYKAGIMEFYTDSRKLISVTFPITGYLDYDGHEIYHVAASESDGELYVWRSRNAGDNSSFHFQANKTRVLGIWDGNMPTDGFSVRPMKIKD